MSALTEQEQGSAQPDSNNPRTWSLRKKIALVTGPNLAAFTTLFGIPIYIASIPGVQKQFHISTTLAITPITFYSLGQTIGPIAASGISEHYGRQIIYRVCVPLALLFTATAGAATNIQTLIILRFLASLAIAPCGPVAVGVVNDLWDPTSQVGSIFALILGMMFIFPAFLGSMISLTVVSYHSWRWTFWTNAIFLAFVLVTTLWLPETYEPQIRRKMAKKSEKEGLTTDNPDTGSSSTSTKIAPKDLLVRPILMLAHDPILLPTCLVSSISLAIVYFFYVAYPLVFTELYSFNPRQIALSFLPLIVGALFAVPVIGYFEKAKYQKHKLQAEAEGKEVRPEMKLYPAMVGSVGMPISLFWLAWTAYARIHWIAPMLSGLLYGMSFTCIMLGYPIYKNSIYTASLGASAFAAETMLRYLIASTIPLYSIQMVNGMGVHWAVTLLAFIALLLLPVPWVLFRYGDALRSRSRYVPYSMAGRRDDDDDQPPPTTDDGTARTDHATAAEKGATRSVGNTTRHGAGERERGVGRTSTGTGASAGANGIGAGHDDAAGRSTVPSGRAAAADLDVDIGAPFSVSRDIANDIVTPFPPSAAAAGGPSASPAASARGSRQKSLALYYSK